VRKPFLKPYYYLKGDYAKAQKLKEQGDALILEIIRERQASGKKQDDLLDMLIETRYEDGAGMTDRQLLDEALILYVAGHETSAMAMSWAWYLLATHPEVEQKLLQSVKDTLGDSDPTFEQTRNLGYALQVVEETMRLYPPAWIIDREALEDDEFEGVKIKKGQGVNCLIYSVHHNEKYWHNAEQFDPERFTTENKAKQLPYSYMPFGGGPRLCIGNNFALMEMQFVLAMMVRRYTFELVPNQRIDVNPLITLRPRNGIKVKVRKRK
jgi:cytochrome P450